MRYKPCLVREVGMTGVRTFLGHSWELPAVQTSCRYGDTGAHDDRLRFLDPSDSRTAHPAVGDSL